MITTAEQKTVSTRSAYLRWAMVSTAAAGAMALGIIVAEANPPSAGNSCSVRHASLRDADGRMMSCSPAMASHQLVWQYT
jgi:hypothetical protein